MLTNSINYCHKHRPHGLFSICLLTFSRSRLGIWDDRRLTSGRPTSSRCQHYQYHTIPHHAFVLFSSITHILFLFTTYEWLMLHGGINTTYAPDILLRSRSRFTIAQQFLWSTNQGTPLASDRQTSFHPLCTVVAVATINRNHQDARSKTPGPWEPQDSFEESPVAHFFANKFCGEF